MLEIAVFITKNLTVYNSVNFQNVVTKFCAVAKLVSIISCKFCFGWDLAVYHQNSFFFTQTHCRKHTESANHHHAMSAAVTLGFHLLAFTLKYMPCNNRISRSGQFSHTQDIIAMLEKMKTTSGIRIRVRIQILTKSNRLLLVSVSCPHYRA